MHDRYRARRLWVLGMAAGLAGAAAPGQEPACKLLPLPDADRVALEKFVGTGVIGQAIPAPPIDDAAAYYGLREATWYGKLAGGSGPPQIKWALRRAEGESGTVWRGETESIVRLVQLSGEGNVEVSSETDDKQGVVSQFSPPQRRISKNLGAGESEVIDIAVKVCDRRNPDRVRHQGSLTLTTTYVGAYEVSVPAGTYPAIFIRSHYKGKVGPANVENTVYFFYAMGVGPVVFVDQKSISALLLYRDTTRVGFVLEKVEGPS